MSEGAEDSVSLETPVVDPVIVAVEESSRPKRERKSVDVYKPPAETPKKEVLIGEGSGIQLGDYEFFLQGFEKVKSDADVCSGLHSLCYGQVGTKLDRKKNIRKFSGYSDTEGIKKVEQAKVEYPPTLR